MPGEGFSSALERRISLWIVLLLVKTSVTPNMVTVLSILSGAAGVVFLAAPPGWCYGLGLFLILGWSLLDAVDGDLARAKDMCGLKGIYIDLLGHYAVNPGIFASFPLYLGWVYDEPLFVMLAFLAYVVHLYSRLAGNVARSIRWEQVDPESDPRHAIPGFKPEARHGAAPDRVPRTARLFARYFLDPLSITAIYGLLRLLTAYGPVSWSLAVFLTLMALVTAGSGVCVWMEMKKLG